MELVNKEKTQFPRWIIGLGIAAIIFLIVHLIINLVAENILTTNSDPNADLFLIPFLPLYFIPLIVMAIFIGLSYSQKKRGISQFNKTHVPLLILIIVGLFISNLLLGFLTPTVSEKSVEACTHYANGVREEFCIKNVCNRQLYSDDCLLNAAIEYRSFFACDHVKSIRNACSCYFKASEKNVSNYVSNFILEGGNCSVISNLDEFTVACLAIKGKDKSLCEKLDDAPRQSSERSIFGIFR